MFSTNCISNACPEWYEKVRNISKQTIRTGGEKKRKTGRKRTVSLKAECLTRGYMIWSRLPFSPLLAECCKWGSLCSGRPSRCREEMKSSVMFIALSPVGRAKKVFNLLNDGCYPSWYSRKVAWNSIWANIKKMYALKLITNFIWKGELVIWKKTFPYSKHSILLVSVREFLIAYLRYYYAISSLKTTWLFFSTNYASPYIHTQKKQNQKKRKQNKKGKFMYHFILEWLVYFVLKISFYFYFYIHFPPKPNLSSVFWEAGNSKV